MAKLEALSAEQEIYAPPEAVKSRATLQDYDAEHRRSVDENEAFWAEAARALTWTKPWERVLEFDGVNHRWFVGGETNITLSAFERHLGAGRQDRLHLARRGRDRKTPLLPGALSPG